MMFVSAPPPGKPVKVVRDTDARYEFFLLENNGAPKFKICVKYRPTGTRLSRSTCNSPPPFNVVSQGPILHPFWSFDPHLGFAAQAEQIAELANKELLKDKELSKDDLKRLKGIVRQSFQQTLPFNPVGTR
ncbi:MAG: hypothetical protein AAF449_05200 [Myxococcota bacterium]